jgi:hypothetical protein
MHDFGQPVRLPRPGGFLLRRAIAGTDDFDAIGPYLLFCCTDWSSLPADLAELGDRVVGAVVVTDSFSPGDPTAPGYGTSHGLVR